MITIRWMSILAILVGCSLSDDRHKPTPEVCAQIDDLTNCVEQGCSLFLNSHFGYYLDGVCTLQPEKTRTQCLQLYEEGIETDQAISGYWRKTSDGRIEVMINQVGYLLDGWLPCDQLTEGMLCHCDIFGPEYRGEAEPQAPPSVEECEAIHNTATCRNRGCSVVKAERGTRDAAQCKMLDITRQSLCMLLNKEVMDSGDHDRWYIDFYRPRPDGKEDIILTDGGYALKGGWLPCAERYCSCKEAIPGLFLH